jgi:hypothetical protein
MELAIYLRRRERRHRVIAILKIKTLAQVNSWYGQSAAMEDLALGFIVWVAGSMENLG